MKYNEFIGKVQNLAGLPSSEEAVAITRVTLETLATRLSGEEPDHIASQLPDEIGRFLTEGRRSGAGERFSLAEFYQRVARLTGAEEPAARQHARVVMSVLCNAVPPRELRDMQAQLPDEFEPLINPPEGQDSRPQSPQPKRPARRGRRKGSSDGGQDQA